MILMSTDRIYYDILVCSGVRHDMILRNVMYKI